MRLLLFLMLTHKHIIYHTSRPLSPGVRTNKFEKTKQLYLKYCKKNYIVVDFYFIKLTQYLATDEDDTEMEGRVKNVLEAKAIGRSLITQIETDEYIKLNSWDQSYGGLFRAVQLEKIMVSLLMSLILLVAVLSLLMSVNNLIKNNRIYMDMVSMMTGFGIMPS